MQVLTYILIGLLIATGLFLVVAVLLQQGKSKGGLSGTIVGGTETFYGKEKGVQRDRFLSRMTTIAAIVFVVLVLAVYFIQPDFSYDSGNDSPVMMLVKTLGL
ncbi:MAG: preprotein translocase subunit SecG [Clostridia bacterium]|nr:preprotein translocase subunit SecG [Clostridia bacterium]